MSHLVSRILLAVFLIPAAAIMYIPVFFYCGETLRLDFMANVVAGAITWAFIAVYWTLIWSSSVRWNARRIVGTIIAAVILVIVGTAFAFLSDQLVRFSGGMSGAFCASIFVPTAWLIATIFLWRETVEERQARVNGTSTKAVTCPTCGYNLTGLTVARCPECGKQYTLDELLAAQTSSPVEEVES